MDGWLHFLSLLAAVKHPRGLNQLLFHSLQTLIRLDSCMDGCMDGWKDAWMDEA